MIKKFILVVIYIILIISFINAKPCCRVYGYLGSWSAPSGWTLDSIDWEALTHVIDSFAIPNSNGTVSTSALRLSPLVNKAHSKNTRCLFSVGGATGSSGFATATSSTYRTTFVNNLINIMTTYGYDGIDIDWEFPRSWDRSNFMAFMQQLYNAVKSSGNGYDGQPRELTFYTTTGWYDDGVDWGTIGNYVDYAIQSGYDWANPANAPLRNTGTLTSAAGYVFENSIHGFGTSIINRGFPRAKFILGLPFYSKPGNVNWGNHGTFNSYNTTYAEGNYSGQWFTDNQGYTAKLAYIRNESRPGIAIWEISQIYPLTDLWNTIKIQSCAGGTPTLTFTSTSTRTFTPTPTRTNTATSTITFTRTNTQTNTTVNTNTFTSTLTYTRTNTLTNTSTHTITGTPPTSTFTFTSTITFTITNTSTITPTPIVTPIRINCGGPQYTGSDSRVWQADKAYTTGSWGYVGGQVGTDTTPGDVLNTVDDTLYHTERYDNPTYRFDVPNGQYTIILYFSEFYYTSAGQRVFSVYIEGSVVLTNYDIIADTGGPDRAVAKQFTVNITDGRIDITSSSTVDLAKISAIEVIQGILTPTPTNTATNTFTRTYTSSNTPTSTQTSTATNTRTSTLTNTLTNTPTNSSTNTYIPSNTQTATFTYTRTNTMTNTLTNTFTQTFTVTYTTTNTSSYTRTNTYTPTSTATNTNSFTITSTATNTFTPTITVTGTQPPTWTSTNTPTNTNSETPSFTTTITTSFTQTITITNTSTSTTTNTATNTSTMTNTNTLTLTPTNTFTYTFTYTNTGTQISTATNTLTYTPTLTQSYTLTLTPTNTSSNTVTFTQTSVISLTQTETITPVLSPIPIGADNLEIVKGSVIFYPQPYSGKGDACIKFRITKTANEIKIKIYTVSFRLVKEIRKNGLFIAGNYEMMLNDGLKKLGNGTYYYIIIVSDDKNQNATSSINKLIIVK